jgi:Carboxypeptidase regulatory-like domain
MVFPRVLLFGLFAAIAIAQTDTGSIAGVITEKSDALITGARVEINNESTNISITVVTNERGYYFAPDLRPGIYSVSVEHPGFKQGVRKGLTLQVGQTARFDFLLELGGTTEKVTVSAAASVLETETSDRGEVIDGRKIVELPLNGRDYNQLAQLSPGVLFQTPRLSAQGFKGAFSVNGNRVFMNAFQLDGVDNTSYAESYRGLNIQALQPSVDAL